MTMPNVRSARAATATLLLASALAACGRGGDASERREAGAASSTGDVVVGVAWPWTARADVLFGEGLDLAVAEVNAAGGIKGRPLRLQKVDDHESVDEGRLIAQRFTKDPAVVAVIGHLQSYVTVPAAAIYDLAGLVMVSPASTAPELTAHGYARVFRTIFTDQQVGRQMALHAAARGFRRVAIYYTRTEYGRGLANAFEEQAKASGMQVADRQSYDASMTENRASSEQTAAAWKNVPLDAVFVAGEAPQAALFIAELRRQGITVPILGGDALGTPALVTVGGAAVEGTTIAASFHPDAPVPNVQKFTAAFRQRYGKAPDAGAALGYDAVGVLADAMRRATSISPAAVATAMHATRDWPGVTGAFTFAPTGDLVASPLLKLVVRQGRFEFLDEARVLAQATVR